jgi:hypothetical protein
MAEGLNLVIDANVSGAVQGLQQVEAQMKKAKTSGDVFSASVVKTSQEQSLEKDVIDKAWVDDYENGGIPF